ncbi:hypothetical protein FOA43_004630 [Brettanomyces nanus]|uniref:Branchpoint-bridging protein n=1 Tax=Eeniella nana TaxID=13502 RepID=A0A875S8L2_EENNA|nr:uncharacterized protein FOA43_004630 [Brettanomyces nanus]QPG77223.1 hypothetical protein FOA43_004630 [Brettanomyces nanus]
MLLNTLTPEQIDAVVTLSRIREIASYGHDAYIPTPESRSPSPPPVYDNTGKRTNTPEDRFFTKCKQERDALMYYASNTIPGYEPPDWFKKNFKITEKLIVPTDKYPDINFVGLLIGPRGNTLRYITKESGAHIGIRGKGSVKMGRISESTAAKMRLDEPLHCLITGESQQQVQKALKMCQDVIDKAVFSGPGQNDLKRNQMKELAVLNGTLRDESEHLCGLCGERGHSRFDCPHKNSIDYINSVVCEKCGNVGHLAKDCKMSAAGGNMDREFESMMREIEDAPEQPSAGPLPLEASHEPSNAPRRAENGLPDSTYNDFQSRDSDRHSDRDWNSQNANERPSNHGYGFSKPYNKSYQQSYQPPSQESQESLQRSYQRPYEQPYQQHYQRPYQQSYRQPFDPAYKRPYERVNNEGQFSHPYQSRVSHSPPPDNHLPRVPPQKPGEYNSPPPKRHHLAPPPGMHSSLPPPPGSISLSLQRKRPRPPPPSGSRPQRPSI